MCCVCGDSVDETVIDPVALVVINRWRRPEDEQMSQQFFNHADCLRSRMVPDVAGNAPTLDPTWEE